MHTIAVRQEIADKFPWALENLFKAFEEAKNRDQIERTEDFFLGTQFRASLGCASRDFGSDRASARLSFWAIAFALPLAISILGAGWVANGAVPPHWLRLMAREAKTDMQMTFCAMAIWLALSIVSCFIRIPAIGNATLASLPFASLGFGGIFVEANAVSPQSVIRMAGFAMLATAWPPYPAPAGITGALFSPAMHGSAFRALH